MKIQTVVQLKKLLNYNPDTGAFTWVVNVGGRCGSRIKAGSIAGTINSKGYRVINIKGSLHREHRLAFLFMTGSYPKYEVDHINRERCDNRWVNLRDVTHKDNLQNRIFVPKPVGRFGVYWDKCKGLWKVTIPLYGKSKHLGYFKNKQDAISFGTESELDFNNINKVGV